MTTLHETYRDIDGQDAFDLLRPLNWDLGIRNRRILTRSGCPQMGRWIEFKIGMAASTCDVTVRLTTADLFEVTISKTRKTRGVPTTTILRRMTSLFAEDLTGSLQRAWCSLCSEKGW